MTSDLKSSLHAPKTSLLVQLLPSLGTVDAQLFGVQDGTSILPHHKLQRRRWYPCTGSLAQKLTKQRELTKEVASMTPCSSSRLSPCKVCLAFEQIHSKVRPNTGAREPSQESASHCILSKAIRAMETPDASHIVGPETTSPQILTNKTSPGLLKCVLEHWVHCAGPQSPTLWICHHLPQREAKCSRG